MFVILFGIIQTIKKEGVNMTTGEIIKNLRKEKGLTQEQLAELVEVSLMTIRRWEWGNTVPNATLIKKLAEKLDTTPEILLNDTEMNVTGENEKENAEMGTTEHTKMEGMASFSLGNGCNFSAPATPEGLAFLERALAVVIQGIKGLQPITA